MTRLRLFTHPMCHGCAEALGLLGRFAQEQPKIEVQLVSLATAHGRAIAHEAGVVIVPTLVMDGEQFVGVPSWEELCALVQRAHRIGGAV